MEFLIKLLPMLIKQSCILISESVSCFRIPKLTGISLLQLLSPYQIPFIRLDINYFYVVHESGKGLISYARGRPTKDRKSATTNGFECTLEMSDKISELRTDHNMHEDTKMLLFISIATNDMVKYVCMYPEVWFLDCTYGELTHHLSILLTYLYYIISYVTV